MRQARDSLVVSVSASCCKDYDVLRYFSFILFVAEILTAIQKFIFQCFPKVFYRTIVTKAALVTHYQQVQVAIVLVRIG
jgi:hypothetical protein